MTTAMMTAMMTSISEVMETMFFQPVEFEQDQLPGPAVLDTPEPVMTCQLKFSGDFSGFFILVVPKDLLSTLAQNFMGETEKTLDPSLLEGTLTEMLNMIGGNALKKLESNVPFELDIPEIKDLDTGKTKPVFFTLVRTTGSTMAAGIVLDE